MGKFNVKSDLINCSVENAFDYVSDITNRPEWQDVLVEIEQHGNQTSGAGTVWTDVFKLFGIKQRAQMSYTEFSPSDFFIETINMPISSGHIEVRFVEEQNGCRITILSDLTWKVPFKLFSKIIEKGLKKSIQQDLKNIQRVLES